MTDNLNTYRIKLDYVPLGFGSRGKASMIFYAGRPAPPTPVQNAALGDRLGNVLREVFPTNAGLQGMTVSRMQNDGKVVRHSAHSVSLNQSGQYVIPAGSTLAHEQAVVVIRKSAQNANPSKTSLRYALTSDEFATFTETGVLPVRFTEVPNYPGLNLATAIRQAITADGWTMQILSVVSPGLFAGENVTSVGMQGAGNKKATRRRTSAERLQAAGVQQEINQLFRTEQRLFNQFANGAHPADIIATILDLAAQASALYLGLPALIRGYISMPNFAAVRPSNAPA